VLRDAGGLSYDVVRAFAGVRARLGWPPAATLKDFRHVFAPGRDAAEACTHPKRLSNAYQRVLRGEYAPVAAAIRTRLAVTG
jgi:hypothetical protein